MISCTGTNFIIRADAGQMVDWFPTYTLGEDMALALALEKAGYCVSPTALPAAHKTSAAQCWEGMKYGLETGQCMTKLIWHKEIFAAVSLCLPASGPPAAVLWLRPQTST